MLHKTLTYSIQHDVLSEDEFLPGEYTIFSKLYKAVEWTSMFHLFYYGPWTH